MRYNDFQSELHLQSLEHRVSASKNSVNISDMGAFHSLREECFLSFLKVSDMGASRMCVPSLYEFAETDHPDANLLACAMWCSEAEERAKREAEEQAQQEEAMEPQEVQTEAEQSKPKGDTLAGEGCESAEGDRAPDGTAGEKKQESFGNESPPLQNGTSAPVWSQGKTHLWPASMWSKHKDWRKWYGLILVDE